LAWEACGPDVGVRDRCRIDTLNVLFRDNVREMLCEHAATKSLLLALEDALDSGALEAQVEAAHAGEERRVV